MPYPAIRRERGFTLVEIAIVLVIVGLLLGAVLKGQELIFNTKIKSTYNLSKETAAALYAYQDRYRIGTGNEGLRTAFGGVAQPARWENWFARAGNNPAMGYHPAGVTHKIMSTIDNSYDDGNPGTGSVRCRNIAAYDQVNFDARTPSWCSVAM